MSYCPFNKCCEATKERCYLDLSATTFQGRRSNIALSSTQLLLPYLGTERQLPRRSDSSLKAVSSLTCTNIALMKPANQSTTVRGGAAANGNDGERTPVHDGKSCTETMKEASPWWMVDLLKPYPVRVVRVATRGCCGHQPLKDIEIRVGNSSSDLQRNPLCAWFPGTIEEGVTKTFTCARTLVGQHVFLQLVGVEGSLSVCEVEVFTTDEFSNDRCAPPGSSPDVELASFDRTCYELSIARGGSFLDARTHCQKHGGDLVHGLEGAATPFLLAQLERRKPTLKTQLVWIGATKEPGFTTRTWRWVNGEVVSRPSWGKEQPNNYNGEQNCVVLDGGRNWLWNDVGCNLDYLHWVCQRYLELRYRPTRLVSFTSAHIDLSSPLCHSPRPSLLGDKASLEVVLRISHSFLSFDRIKPMSGEWAVTIDFLQEAAITFLSNGSNVQSPSDCGSPDKLLNTTISGSNYSVEAVISYQCPLGHRLVGEKNRSCTVNGFWSGQAPGCQYVDCGSLSKLDHGVVMLEDNRTTHGAWARYSCHENYTLTGREKRQCGDDGKWSDEPPQCLFDWCPEPPVVHGGTVEVSGRRTGSVAIYTCKSGFIPFGEPQVLSCGLGGEWSGKAPTCKYVDCGAPPNTDNGRYNLLNGTTYGSIVEYSCDVDYWLDGTQRQSCTREGRWSADTPACVLITCDEPEVPPNSEVVGYDFNVHSSIEYRCEVGHLLRGEAIRECTMQGEWSGEPPACEYIDCGKVPSMPYGSVTYVNETTYIGSQILYSCVRNYRLTGVSYRECQENKQWSGESSRCEEIRCPEPTLTDHSILSVTGNDRVYGRTLIRTADSAASVTTYKIGALAKYRCERGYKIVGEPLSTCEDTGRWSGEMPQCACEYNCHTPDTYIDTPVNYQQQGDAFFTPKNSFTKNVNDAHLRTHDLAVDDPTNYNVRVNTNNLMNYQIQEVKSHFLDNNIISSPVNRHKFGIEKPVIHVPVNYLRPEARPWRGNMPALILDTYPPINEIQDVNPNSQPYSRHQNEQPLHTQNKQRYKNKLKETNKDVDCGMPEPLAHGHFTLASNATYYGVVVLYDCDPNFELDGHGRRLCMENGTWSSDTPVCKEITCGNLQTEGTMSVQVMTHSVGGVAHYSCPKGQYMVGNSTRVCTKKGTWTGHAPECKFVDCQHPGPIENGRVIVMNQTTTYNGAAEYHCVPHYERIGPYLRKCMDDGTWSGEEPRCEMTTNEVSEPQSLGMTIGIAAGVVVFLMLILGLIYLRLRKATPVKNTENVQAAIRKEDQNAAVMSYANLNDSNGYGMPPNHPNIYENIHDNDHTYDAPYEETRHHYEASPVSRTASGPVVTINGVAVR
uniref:(California timema) hypothetical protein n=1 Tax=Timema californicum TaxID=61474 RepID=A0A7R9IYX1_TIMCA|nr:unnamed protein product [Timema californicum]